MTTNLPLRLLGFVTLVVAAQVVSAKQEGPEALPISLLSQLHNVPASNVSTEVIELVGNSAIVTASVGDQQCVFDMTQAPEGVEAPGGWLAGGMDCSER